MQRFIESIWAALAVGVPLIVTALVSLFLQWLRLRRAKLRAQRMLLPPSSEPPEPPEPWYSLRPRRQRKRKDKRS
jgi:hypothetical protein